MGGHTKEWQVVTPYPYRGTYEISTALDNEHAANLRLIEYAPDLLAALRSFLADHRSSARGFGRDACNCTTCVCGNAALTKAEGK